MYMYDIQVFIASTYYASGRGNDFRQLELEEEAWSQPPTLRRLAGNTSVFLPCARVR